MGSMAYNVSDYAHPLISERAIDEPRPLKVIYIGAGVSGICAGIQFPKFVPNLELVIYEKNADIGGTWLENRYPGCACDIPAHSYQLSYESDVTWSKFYAGASEILEYWRRVVAKYNLRRHMKFRHKCIEARWNEQTSKWHVKFGMLDTGDVVEDTADVLVTGVGSLNTWKWPDIHGLHDFEGKLLHSANWDPDCDVSGQKVAVIGSGSSGIQIVPTLQPHVEIMDHYVRGRTWIAASFGSEFVRARRDDGRDGNFDYTAQEIDEWRANPAAYLRYRKTLEVGMQSGFALTQRGSQENQAAWAAFDKDMRTRLAKKSHIAEHLLPKFPPLCKRLTPGPGYLEALVADNVNVIPEAIVSVSKTGITTADGVFRPVDTIICATGFDTTYRGQFPIYGRDGINLQSRNEVRAESYLGLTRDGYPNFFQSLGPNSGAVNGNLLLIIESVASYIGQILQKLAAGNVKTIEVKRGPVENFSRYCDAFFERTVFTADCGGWFKVAPPGATPEERRRGRITALWPGSSVHVARTLERVRFEDYDMTTVDGNDFGWFGDGWTTAERTKDPEGLSWYLNDTNFTHDPLKEISKHAVQNSHLPAAKVVIGDDAVNGVGTVASHKGGMVTEVEASGEVLVG